MNVLMMGGTNYFGKRLVEKLIESGHDVTLATRGQKPDQFGNKVRRHQFNRQDRSSLEKLAKTDNWDIVYDQICYSPNEALFACELFEGRVGRYVHTSTGSVYTSAGEQSESDFNPYTHLIRMGNRSDFDYGEGKRQAEAVFFQRAKFPVVAMRIPIVLGTDDYTGRLEFHIDRIRDGRPIVVSNLSSRTCFINSSEAARFLFWLGFGNFVGPLNGCSNGTISIGEIIGLIEKQLEKKAKIVERGLDSDATPFVGPESKFSNNSRAVKLGFQFDALNSWLPDLINELSKRGSRHR